MKSNIICLILLLGSTLCAVTRTVSHDGTAQFTTIQWAINASSTGDTVLVYPGRYLENVYFNAHSLTLASMEITTGDPTYISTTIIDGNQQNSCIFINNENVHAQIRGLSITNGRGHWFSVGGVRYGGGIFCQYAPQISIINCRIYGNSADEGGGILLSGSNIFLSGTSIFSNSANHDGGGIKFQNDYIAQNTVSFDSQNKCSIYNNQANWGLDCQFNYYNSVHVVLDTCTVINPLNYFITGYASNPNIENPIFCEVEHTYMTEINHDLYVAPNGSDTNDGLSEATPLRSIYYAVYHIASDSLNPKTVHLAPGNYSYPNNYLQYGIPLKSWTILNGVSRETTILDGEGTYYFIFPAMGSSHVTISNLTCRNSNVSVGSNRGRNLLIDNIIVEDASSDYGPGIGITKSRDFRIKNTIVENNSATYSYPGFELGDDSGTNYLINCISENNTSQGDGNGLRYDDNGTLIIDGCTFKRNSSTTDDKPSVFAIGRSSDFDTLKVIMTNSNIIENTQTAYTFMGLISANNGIEISNCVFANNTGGYSAIGILGDVALKNNIFWNPALPVEVYFPWSSDDADNHQEYMSNNIIRNGIDGVVCSSTYTLHWQEGNFSAEPQFFGWGEYPYKISSWSPSVDAGTPDTTGLSLPSYDMYGNPRIVGAFENRPRIDIGSYEYQGVIKADFAVSDTLGPPPLTIQFTDLSRGDITCWKWDFDGDGVTDSEEQNPTATFTQGRVYNPSLIISNGELYDSVRKNRAFIVDPTLSVDDPEAVEIEGLSVYPNPFKNSTTLKLQINSSKSVKVEIFNIRGQKVKTLMDANLSRGVYNMTWDGKDNNRHSLASGIYICSYEIGKNKDKTKITIIK